MDVAIHKKIAVMGYLCLDLFPDFKDGSALEFVPGMLREVGPCNAFAGGVIGNTGLALHKLGMPVKLVGMVGNDAFGQIVRRTLQQSIPESALNLKVSDGETAYCIVMSPPGCDRMFLAHRGANDTLSAADADNVLDENIILLHFGYPPLCREFHIENGKELQKLFRHASNKGIITSLDMSLPSPGSSSYSLDWIAFMRKVMPLTDIFLPSIDELEFMLKPKEKGILAKLRAMTEQLLKFGAAIIAVKIGKDGLYVRTTDDINRLGFLSAVSAGSYQFWQNREFIIPCRQAEVVGTTGAGDATVAGFLAGVMSGDSPETVGLLAVGTGACNVTSHDSISKIKPLLTIRKMLDDGWLPEKLSFEPETIQIIN
jgi:sugar/nucleoside kinase (ribokinase family)